MTFKLENGVILDTDHNGAKSITEYAKSKGLKRIFAAKATHPDGAEVYVLFEREPKASIPIYESSRSEDVGCHIDMLAADQEFSNFSPKK